VVADGQHLSAWMIEVTEDLQRGDPPAADETDVDAFERGHGGLITRTRPLRLWSGPRGRILN
jgi:hypothetical protein